MLLGLGVPPPHHHHGGHHGGGFYPPPWEYGGYILDQGPSEVVVTQPDTGTLISGISNQTLLIAAGVAAATALLATMLLRR